jgi:hypothetical protein
MVTYRLLLNAFYTHLIPYGAISNMNKSCALLNNYNIFSIYNSSKKMNLISVIEFHAMEDFLYIVFHSDLSVCVHIPHTDAEWAADMRLYQH